MLPASRVALRGAFREARRPPQPPAASLHTTSSLRSPPGPIPHFIASNHVRTARHTITRILSHILSIPVRSNAPITRVLSRGISTTPTTIGVKQSLSLSSRVPSPRPFGVPFILRSPHIAANRSISQVGLGTARNFSSGRPVFQNLLQNVPVAGRALSEIDFDLKMKKDNLKRRNLPKKTKTSQARRKDMLMSSTPSTSGFSPTLFPESLDVESSGTDYSDYFMEPPTEPFITTLSIPLSPSVTRAPLGAPPEISTGALIFSVHNSYSVHSIRVASLFRRLDQANVWSRGATCDCIDTTGEGLPRMLRVRLDGWTEQMLRDAIGEAGMGWCEISSAPRASPADPLSVQLSHDNMSLAMPTLDFSASFPLDTRPFVATGVSTTHEGTDEEEGSYGFTDAEDAWAGTDSEFETGMESEIGSDGWEVSSGSAVQRIAFSSSFMHRMD